MIYLFWISLTIIFYSYGGYAIIAKIWIKINTFYSLKTVKFEESFTPKITLIIAAYNEEDLIKEKIENSLSLNYPKENLEIIIVTDGSSDQTPKIIEQFSEIKLMHLNERSGKAAAVNRAVNEAKNEILVFCDANTLLNKDALTYLSSPYIDPEVGGVSGEKKVKILEGEVASGGEGLYWKYESYLKKIDSELYSIVGAAGELFSVRRNLYDFIDPSIILDDFVISLKVNLKGYRVIYEPRAYAEEYGSASVKDERKRKVRITAGGFQAISILGSLWNVFKHPRLTFLYISHRVLRWTLCPIALITIFISNLFILTNTFYLLIFSFQILFYGLATVGWIQSSQTKVNKLFYLPFYFAFMNFSVFQGFIMFLGKKQSSVWDKSARLKRG